MEGSYSGGFHILFAHRPMMWRMIMQFLCPVFHSDKNGARLEPRRAPIWKYEIFQKIDL